MAGSSHACGRGLLSLGTMIASVSDAGAKQGPSKDSPCRLAMDIVLPATIFFILKTQLQTTFGGRPFPPTATLEPIALIATTIYFCSYSTFPSGVTTVPNIRVQYFLATLLCPSTNSCH